MCRLQFAEERLRCFLQLHRGNTAGKQEAKAKKRRLQTDELSAAGSGRGSQGKVQATDVLQVELQRLTADRACLAARIEVKPCCQMHVFDANKMCAHAHRHCVGVSHLQLCCGMYPACDKCALQGTKAKQH